MLVHYWVNCFDRELIIEFPSGYEHLQSEIAKMIDDYYVEWHHAEDIEDPEERFIVLDSCLEEYMMSRLSETYNMWIQWWVEEEEII